MGENRVPEDWQPDTAMRACREDVAKAFGVEPHRLIGRSRVREVMLPRQAACYVLRARFPELSWPKIGHILGGRDHSTVIHGAREAVGRRSRDPEYSRVLDELAAGRVPSFRALPRPKAEPIPKVLPTPVTTNSIKPMNALEDDDRDARRRHRGSRALAEALKREGMVCR